MLCFLLAVFVFASNEQRPKPGGEVSSGALVRQQLSVVPTNKMCIVSVPNGLMAKMREALGLELLFPILADSYSEGLQVNLTYKKLPHTDEPAAASITREVYLDLKEYCRLLMPEESSREQKPKAVDLKFSAFRAQIKQHVVELFELAYRYLVEYRAPKHALRWRREVLEWVDCALVFAGQLSGVVSFAKSSDGDAGKAVGLGLSVGSAGLGYLGVWWAKSMKKAEEEYFKMRDEIDGKIRTLLSFYAGPEAVDVLKLLQTIIVDVLGYSDPKIMQEKLKKAWPYIASYFPKDTSTVAINVTVGNEPTTGDNAASAASSGDSHRRR